VVAAVAELGAQRNALRPEPFDKLRTAPVEGRVRVKGGL
jgi:hypothetical protein